MQQKYRTTAIFNKSIQQQQLSQISQQKMNVTADNRQAK